MATTDSLEGPSDRTAHLVWRGVGLAIWLAATLRFWWVCDDAYISFRFARNWAEGHGPRFNLGEHVPVEGYTNFLWMAASAAVEWAGARPDVVMPVLSVACGAVLLVRYHALLAGHFALPPALAGLLLLGLAVFPPFAVWSTSGMETMAQCLLLFLACEALLVRRSSGVSAGLAALGAALVRFDGVAWGAAIGVAALLSPAGRDADGLRRLGRYAAVLGGGFLVYYAWRFSYYEAALPNTVYVKVGLRPDVLLRGVRYLLSHWLTLLTPFALVAAIPVALAKRWRDWGLPLVALAAAGIAYPVATGGDFMAMGRFLLPATVFGAFLLVPLHAELFARRPAAALALAVVLGLAAQPAALGRSLAPRGAMAALHFRYNMPAEAQRTELQQWKFMKRNAAYWKQRGRAMGLAAQPDESWVVGALGATGYFSRMVTWDEAGLVVPEVARRAQAGPLASPGHDKTLEREDLLFLEPDHLEVWLFTGACTPDPIGRDLPPGGGGLRTPKITARYAPVRLPLVERAGLPFRSVWSLRRVEDAAEREHLWAAFDAGRPRPCVRARSAR